MTHRTIVTTLGILFALAVAAGLYSQHVAVKRRLDGPGGGYQCGSHLQKIGMALLLYGREHEGRYPFHLEDLLAPDGLQPWALTCPSVSPPASNAFVFVAPGRVAAEIQADEIVAHEPLSNHDGDGAMALFGDGHVEWMTPAELRDQLASPPTTRETGSTAPSTFERPGS